MRQGSTLFLKFTIYLIGIAILAVCVFALPLGIRAEDAGGYRLILMGLYLPAIPFYVALYQSLKLLGNIDRNMAFSASSLKALKNIKYCAISISIIFAAGMPFIIRVADMDDAPGVVAMGLVIIFASIVIATFATLLHMLFKNGMEIKSENDLTV
jgi:hypothetical protein